ncbi:MAG: metalloprotease PmbA [Burkholderiales bacterium]|jgi:PmbA protein|nr:metalloprotease PmbA [Burkholderiales bacterium]MCA3160825.1 metalloprotease PmbA [Burkholderiales bacterium]MCA3163614.1 metalloprotease PmbA [Burkholderiales bacterium]MCA3166292.1 metalloprotease PmbA [Burkholderiales bacterium]MCA3170082.1 metalloprotease PmbA [Burkholderiales bacterium]
MASADFFPHTQDQLAELVSEVLKVARQRGASDCAAEVSEGSGLSVSVRKGQVETIEQNRDKGLGVTVYLGQRKGHASTSDFSRKALHDTVQAALDIARYTAEDECAGLPDADVIERAPRDLDLFHPWPIQAQQAIELARRAEAAAFAVAPAISNSEGASVTAQHSQFMLANSRGFLGGYPYSRHSLWVAPIAKQGQDMQRDDWYSSERDSARLADPEVLGRYAAQRALARLGARKLSTRTCPVLFEAPLATGLLGSLVQALSGGALYRRSSFLLDSLGQQVLASHVNLEENPNLRGASGSAPFDEEGVRTQARQVVRRGVIQGYFLSSYSARKLGMKTTGNAGGSHNLRLSSESTAAGDDFAAMLKRMGTGLLVTELMGQGVNYVTGDYSRGASGYWVENGVIAYPVEEVTIAGNLKQMLQQIVAIGSDEIVRGTKKTGSILIESMTLAGN